MQRECLAVVGLSRRFADLANRLASESSEPGRKMELSALAGRCFRVPDQPSACFAEAVQSVWMLHFALAYAGNPLSIGRLDQVLAPYLERDLDEGRITMEEAQEMIDSLFLHLGGNMLTLTATSVEDLKRAMENPEAYRGLRVRMGGWTGYFVQMSRQQQENFIERIAHGA